MSTRKDHYPHVDIHIDPHPDRRYGGYLVDAFLYEGPDSEPESAGIDGTTETTKKDARDTAKYFAEQLMRSGNAKTITIFDNGSEIGFYTESKPVRKRKR